MGLTAALGILSVVLIGYSFGNPITNQESNLYGRLLPKQLKENQKWVTITEEDVRTGYSLQPDVNNLLHIPEEIDRITRRTLFGRDSTDVRYWGYCFPRTYEEAEALKRAGFPGTIFLSEKEREIRRQIFISNRANSITSYKELSDDVLNNRIPRTYGAIRHQQEIFEGGMICYVMSSETLAIGSDEDGDGANIRIENDHGSDPKLYDTDGDGIWDGLEIFNLGTSPIQRDSDGDGLIDGIEDANRNGRTDVGEPNPMKWDTDRDGLCDGLCKVKNGTELRGEDKNLDGILDEGETDPTTNDTDGDEILDEQEYFNCVLAGGDDC